MITNLLLKPQHGQPLIAAEALELDAANGIKGNVRTSPLRQVLLLEARTLAEFNLNPGDLRENIIGEGLDLYALTSGTVLRVGAVDIALTFLCEPCRIIADKVNLKDIRHKRGYLGRVLNQGVIRLGDPVIVTDRREEVIPEDAAARIKWYLAKHPQPIRAAELMWQVGLASSYCRALPAILRKHPDIPADRIVFANQVKM